MWFGLRRFGPFPRTPRGPQRSPHSRRASRGMAGRAHEHQGAATVSIVARSFWSLAFVVSVWALVCVLVSLARSRVLLCCGGSQGLLAGRARSRWLAPAYSAGYSGCMLVFVGAMRMASVLSFLRPCRPVLPWAVWPLQRLSGESPPEGSERSKAQRWHLTVVCCYT